MAGNTPGDIVDMKEKRRYIRKEMREHNTAETFYLAKQNVDQKLMDHLLEVITKANAALNAHSLFNYENFTDNEQQLKELKDKYKAASGEARKIAEKEYKFFKAKNCLPDNEKEPQLDKLKMIEMQLNKDNSMLERAKMVILRLDKMVLAIPYTISRIEVRARSALINQRSILDGISHFLQFYLVNQNYHTELMKSYKEHLADIERLDYEARFQVRSPSGRTHTKLIRMRNQG